MRYITSFPARSSRHEKMSEMGPQAALVRLILICTDELRGLRPGSRHPAPEQSTQPPNERSAERQWEHSQAAATL